MYAAYFLGSSLLTTPSQPPLSSPLIVTLIFLNHTDKRWVLAATLTSYPSLQMLLSLLRMETFLLCTLPTQAIQLPVYLIVSASFPSTLSELKHTPSLHPDKGLSQKQQRRHTNPAIPDIVVILNLYLLRFKSVLWLPSILELLAVYVLWFIWNTKAT